jgi:DNA-directed RNA polymerase specialized sigma24 family protein
MILLDGPQLEDRVAVQQARDIAFAAMNEQQRAVMTSAVEGLSLVETSALLRISETRVRELYSGARLTAWRAVRRAESSANSRRYADARFAYTLYPEGVELRRLSASQRAA